MFSLFSPVQGITYFLKESIKLASNTARGSDSPVFPQASLGSMVWPVARTSMPYFASLFSLSCSVGFNNLLSALPGYLGAILLHAAPATSEASPFRREHISPGD